MLIVWFFAYKKLAQFAVRCALPPRRSESPVCATVNKPSCVLHLLGWFIGSRGFSSLERRPEFWVLHYYGEHFEKYIQILSHYIVYHKTNTMFHVNSTLITNRINKGKNKIVSVCIQLDLKYGKP